MRKLLWVGDAVVASGFARSTHHVLETVRQGWDVTVLGLNYLGDPHSYPYPVYPCWSGGDAFGVSRIKKLVSDLQPDVVVIQNDPWNIPAYIKQLRGFKGHIISVCPVDGKNCRGEGLNDCDATVFWTKFGVHEARLGGYTKPAYVVPLGVDLQIYRPMDKGESRRYLKLPYDIENGFIVGNVNRNQPRKRLDLTISFFADWVHSYKVEDAFLYLHVAPTGDMGYDVIQLMRYYGLKKRLILNVPEIGQGESEEDLSLTYSTFDVQVNTGQGEGWGLTTLEGMACGIPQIVPEWSALGEWAEGVARTIPCNEIAVTPNNVNVLGGVPDRELFVSALHEMYLSGADYRAKFSRKGLELAGRNEYRWENIGQQYLTVLDEVCSSTKEAVS